MGKTKLQQYSKRGKRAIINDDGSATQEDIKDINKPTQGKPLSLDPKEDNDSDGNNSNDFHDYSAIEQTSKQSMEEAKESSLEDMTETVNDLKSDLNLDYKLQKRPIIYSQAQTDKAPKPPDYLLKALEWVRMVKQTIDTVTYRDLDDGIIDRRKLYKASYSDHVYKVFRNVPRQKLDLVLLVDASSSMYGPKESIYDAVYALHTLIPETKIYSYNATNNLNSKQGGIQVYSHTYDYIHKIKPMGDTPTGDALLVTAIKHPRSMIIHFTDGISNTGEIKPVDALRLIKDKLPGVQVVNIFMLSSNSRMPSKQVKVAIQDRWGDMPMTMIHDVDEFPSVLREAIKPWYRGG